jgi:hypothetical protein
MILMLCIILFYGECSLYVFVFGFYEWFYIYICFIFDWVLTKKYNKIRMRNNILNKVNYKIECLLECVVKKTVTKVVSCTFWIDKLTTLVGDALRSCSSIEVPLFSEILEGTSPRWSDARSFLQAIKPPWAQGLVGLSGSPMDLSFFIGFVIFYRDILFFILPNPSPLSCRKMDPT